jgi:hypothetical protein
LGQSAAGIVQLVQHPIDTIGGGVTQSMNGIDDAYNSGDYFDSGAKTGSLLLNTALAVDGGLAAGRSAVQVSRNLLRTGGDLATRSAIKVAGWIQPPELPVADTAPTATQLRNTPGVATVSVDLQPVSGRWLDAATPTPIPSQVGDALAGKEFRTFDDLRGAIWENIGNNPDLTVGFSRQNIVQMQNGFAPFAPSEFLNDSGAFGQSFNLHHFEPISEGGSVYDLSNLQIVSPKVHYDIHYGP